MNEEEEKKIKLDIIELKLHIKMQKLHIFEGRTISE